MELGNVAMKGTKMGR